MKKRFSYKKTGKKRGRPKGSGKKSIEFRPYIHSVSLQCKKCKRKYGEGGEQGYGEGIRTRNPELYTEEVKKNWICPLCKVGNRKTKVEETEHEEVK